jgi:2-succinyl-5-enolpyruvyl-6-hydroxy-3-cyclohexene-1-carboxylate synthase
VVCPGSRSTPLALALAHHPAIAVDVRLDERSAGFTALGMGMATGRPAVVVTTSGTAAAELHAALVEADLAGVPLLACTADRPPELHDVGAPQTIDQVHLFGRSVRWFADPGVGDHIGRRWWRSLAARSVIEATAGPRGPGPVHLNLRFREPLLGDAGAAGGPAPGRSGGLPWHEMAAGPVGPPEGLVDSLVGSGALARGQRGLIVAGAGCGPADAVLGLARTLGWPVLAEPRSGVRREEADVVALADGILRSSLFAERHRPEVVVRLGQRWASRVVNAHLSAAVERGARYVVVDPWGRWSDPEREVTTFVRADPARFCADVTTRLDQVAGVGGGPAPRDPWVLGWERAEAAARSSLATSLGVGSRSPITEPALAHRLFDRMPGHATLVVSSSMPVRDLESFALPRHRPPRVLANRGANGIDGVVSTSLGVAIQSAGPVVALVGDLAFLHDSSALVRGEGSAGNLTVVVADNDGGGIFSFLDPARSLDGEAFERLFGTPQHADVAAVARGFGWPVDDLAAGADGAAFDAALDRCLSVEGGSVIRVGLPGRTENVAIHDRINAAIVESVESVGP